MNPNSIRRLCVFCGSSLGDNPAFRAAAAAVGKMLVRERISLIYGGGSIGLMGVLADSVLESGGEAIGVIPHALRLKELGHSRLSELHVVDTMHERKALMADLASAFVALPGGLGTFEEILEIITWLQLGIHQKPCGILNVEGYYDCLIEFLDHAVERGFVRPEYRAMILIARDPNDMLDQLRAWKPPDIERWVTRTQR